DCLGPTLLRDRDPAILKEPGSFLRAEIADKRLNFLAGHVLKGASCGLEGPGVVSDAGEVARIREVLGPCLGSGLGQVVVQPRDLVWIGLRSEGALIVCRSRYPIAPQVGCVCPLCEIHTGRSTQGTRGECECE